MVLFAECDKFQISIYLNENKIIKLAPSEAFDGNVCQQKKTTHRFQCQIDVNKKGEY